MTILYNVLFRPEHQILSMLSKMPLSKFTYPTDRPGKIANVCFKINPAKG